MYSPHSVFRFLDSKEFREILNKSFYKRHMESDDRESPFNDAEKIFFLEWLIDHNYLIAEYRHDDASDSESYYMSTLGHAYMRNYRQSLGFRIRANLSYSITLYWILFASAIGSLIANYITLLFV